MLQQQKLIRILFYTEACELFGRFSIVTTLVLYLTKILHMSDVRAFSIYTTFAALLFMTPIIGGYFCDNLLGNVRAIIIGATLMVIGNSFLAITTMPAIILGLAVISIGGGFFLPSITSMFGNINHSNQSRDSIFTVYYLAKNVGALLGPLCAGYISLHFGYRYAFLTSSFIMLSGIGVFFVGTKNFAFKKIEKIRLGKKQLLLCLYPLLLIPIIQLVITKQLATYVIITAIAAVIAYLTIYMSKASKTDNKHLVVIILFMLFYIVFEGLLCQGGTTLNLFIDRMVNRNALGHVVPPQAFYALDPTFMFMFGPGLVYMFSKLNKKQREPFVVTKVAAALLILALGFLIFVGMATYAIHGIKPSLLYVVVAYAIFPLAELCIIPTTLSLVTRIAPKNMQSMTVGIFMLSSAIGNYITGLISRLGNVHFAIQSKMDFIHAAHIYRFNFTITAIILSIAAILIYILTPLVRKFMQPVPTPTEDYKTLSPSNI